MKVFFPLMIWAGGASFFGSLLLGVGLLGRCREGDWDLDGEKVIVVIVINLEHKAEAAAMTRLGKCERHRGMIQPCCDL